MGEVDSVFVNCQIIDFFLVCDETETIEVDMSGSLRGVDDSDALAKVVANLVWDTTDTTGIDMNDCSGKGGGKVYIVQRAGSVPEKVILKINSEQSSSSISSDRMQAAVTAIQRAGLVPPTMHKGEDWCIEPFLGVSVAKDRFHFNEKLAPVKELATLLAKIHAIPTDWYEPFRARVTARDPRLTELLKKSPPHSHVWNPFGWGLENGMVFLGGGFPNPAVAKAVMDLQIATGTYSKFMSTEAFWPISKSGRRIVTLHGDFKV